MCVVGADKTTVRELGAVDVWTIPSSYDLGVAVVKIASVTVGIGSTGSILPSL